MTTLERIHELWPQTPLDGPSPREIPNVGREDLARLFADLGFTIGVEIGTERGLYAETLCKVNRDLHLFCVDPWLAYKGYREHTTQSKLDDFYEEALERLKDYDVTFLRQTSLQAAQSDLFNEVTLLWDDERNIEIEDGPIQPDFVYLDGNHNLLHVVQDLYAWIPKVRKGGIIAGHDFIRRKKGRYNAEVHVVEAVTAYTEAHHIHPWYVVGRKAQIEGETRDSARSWFWIKE